MPIADRLVLDTHALLWWQAQSDRLSVAAATRIDLAVSVLISPISCWEIMMLVERGRVALDRPVAVWVNDVVSANGVGIAELAPSIAVGAGQLVDLHRDPADRMIDATAAVTGLPLVTKDRRIHDYADRVGEVAIIW
ncbi:MAG: type II toxin-antitoxin system VapC family toxin [Actinomycetota bacterium]|nr:type II toxin-antitoxin system VapC family toxin [Actinomycetota bacterium]